MASVVDLAHFAEALLASYRAPGGLVSQARIRELWQAHVDIGCGGGCPYERYYGLGFFTDSLPGNPSTGSATAARVRASRPRSCCGRSATWR